MIMVTTQEEYEKLKWYDLVTCRCENKDCEKEFKTIKKNTQLVLMGTRPTEIRFCNRKCSAGEHKRFSKFKVNCKNCKKEFFKTKYQCEKFPNHFCSSSCAATYNNKNKTYGIRRSKFEAYIEDQLIVFYSYLKVQNKGLIFFIYNDKIFHFQKESKNMLFVHMLLRRYWPMYYMF